MSADLEALAAKVKLMRELGISEADGIKLGPPVLTKPPEETAEEFTARINREANAAAARQHQIMFAASSTRPRLRVLK